jgi:hypothetical protein
MCVVQVLCVFKGLFCLDAYLIFKDDFEYYCELLITVLIILVGHDGLYRIHSDSGPKFFETRIGIVICYSQLA